MKILVAYSGGKDSQASLIWALQNYDKKLITAVFCDTGWEHEVTYKHIQDTINILKVPLITLKSKKYDGFIDLAKKKGRFPSTKAKFCTEELKVKPMIDFILDECNDNVTIIQGIRADESKNRNQMKRDCTYFKYYFESYGIDKKGKPKFHTYRKKEVIKFREKYNDDVLRPIIDWTADQVMSYIFENGMLPNPLYKQGNSRVGCYPCIMCRQADIRQMIKHNPDYVTRLENAEKEIGRTFFSPGYIPERYCSGVDTKTGKKLATVTNVVNYMKMKKETVNMFEEEEDVKSCMSIYNICE